MHSTGPAPWLRVAVAMLVALFPAHPTSRGQPPAGSRSSPLQSAHLHEVAEPRGSHIADGFRLAAVGDIIAAAPFTGAKDGPFSAPLEIITGSDVGFGNLEETLIDVQHVSTYPEAENGGMWLIGVPSVAADLRAAGFRVLARANNHSTEWGVSGMRETDRLLDQAGIVHAGTGENRAAARAAGFLETPKGRVALVSMTSTFTPSSVASQPLGRVAGRPGANALRTKEIHIVNQEMMASLAAIADAQTLARDAFTEAGSGRAAASGRTVQELNLFGVAYRVGAKVGGVAYQMNATDLAENLASIKAASGNSDVVIATIHTHEPNNGTEQPPDFMIDLAHRAIDSGADVFSGHGPHQLRGIEIYKGKPIFYSLGDFIFEVEKQSPVPGEMYEALEMDAAKVSDEELDRFFVNKYLNDPVWYQSVIAVTRWDRGRVSEIRLYPVELGFATSDGWRGLPRVPSPEIAQTILRRLQRISAPFHTEIRIEDGVAVIRIAAEWPAGSANRPSMP